MEYSNNVQVWCFPADTSSDDKEDLDQPYRRRASEALYVNNLREEGFEVGGRVVVMNPDGSKKPQREVVGRWLD